MANPQARHTAPPAETPAPAPAARADPGALVELAQPRITGLVVLTAAAGYLMAAGPGAEPATLSLLALGTALACGGTNALNQWAERRRDGRMDRTRRRPLPSGRLPAPAALVAGTAAAAGGVGMLWAGTGALVGVLAGATVLSYLLVYTPAKTRTPWSTWLGTVPGALPVLGGWAAARGDLGITACTLFVLVALWQLPHFFALGWLHREDYARGGFSTLAVVDPSGRRSGRQMTASALLLLGAGLALPLGPGLGLLSGLGGAVGGGLMLAPAAAFLRTPAEEPARRLFAASLLYLPLVLGLGVVDSFV